MKSLKIALIQNKICNDKVKNVESAVSKINYAAQNGAELVVLPEMFCCPYNTAAIKKSAERKGEYIYNELSKAARANHIYLVGGSMPELCDEGIYNTSFVFDRSGDEIARHRKIHLFDVEIEGGVSNKESDTICAGNQTTVFDTEFGKIGLCICYDIRFPEIFRMMVDDGAFMVIVPAVFNTTTGPLHWEMLFKSRAVDNQIFTVGAAPAQNTEGKYISYGHSIVVSPWGDINATLNEEEGIILTDIDLDKVFEVRKQLPLLKHRRKDIY